MVYDFEAVPFILVANVLESKGILLILQSHVLFILRFLNLNEEFSGYDLFIFLCEYFFGYQLKCSRSFIQQLNRLHLNCTSNW